MTRTAERGLRNVSEIRKEHNTDLIRRMRRGETLTTYDSQASWYPPRPIIKKDRAEMARLYKTTPIAFNQARKERDASEGVVVTLPRREGEPSEAR